MPKNAEFITYGKGPADGDAVFFAPSGTTIPNDPFEDMPDTAIGLGHVSDEGDTETPGYGDAEAVYDQDGTPVKYADGDYEPTIAFSLLQSGNDFDVDQVVYGADNVIGSKDEYTINKHAKNKSVGIVVINHEFDNGARERSIYPNATIRLSDDIQNTYTDLRVLPVSVIPAVDSTTGFIGTTTKKSKPVDTEVQG